jgi:hypothetical protein
VVRQQRPLKLLVAQPTILSGSLSLVCLKKPVLDAQARVVASLTEVLVTSLATGLRLGQVKRNADLRGTKLPTTSAHVMTTRGAFAISLVQASKTVFKQMVQLRPQLPHPHPHLHQHPHQLRPPRQLRVQHQLILYGPQN